MKYTGKRGWQASKKDCWSMDSTLAPIIAAGLKKFKEEITEGKHTKGLPSLIIHDFKDELDIKYTKEDNYSLSDEDFSKLAKKYLEVLDEMIFAFDSEEPEMDFEAIYGTGDTLTILENRFVEKDEAAYKLYDTTRTKYYERCEKGRLFFAKYFDTLWW